MSSFTSSSDSAAIHRKTLLAILLGMATVLVLWRVFAELMDASAETIMGRVVEAREALPQILGEPHDLVMFYGSSMVEAGFSPRMFDRWLAEQGIEVRSWNFGFGGLNPYFQDFLSRRIREAFETRDRRLKMAIVEFNPFQATRTRWEGAQSGLDSFLTMLATDRELLEVTRENFERGVRLFVIRYLRNEISAEMATWFFGQSLQARPQGSQLPEDEAAAARRAEILELLDGRLEEDYPDYDGSDWYYPWQGGGTIPADRSEETVALIEELVRTNLTARNLDNDRLRRIHTADILELHFEEVLIDSFIAVVENFKAISDRVVVTLLPRNSEWIEYGPEARARLDAAIARIEQATGILMIDLQEAPQITPDMYSDTTHLGRYTGDLPYTRLLADSVAPLLKEP